MIAAIGDEQLATAVQAAAITPALLFTFVFNYLLIGARRRVMKTGLAAARSRRREAVRSRRAWTAIRRTGRQEPIAGLSEPDLDDRCDPGRRDRVPAISDPLRGGQRS